MTLEQVIAKLKANYGFQDNEITRFGKNFDIKETVIENTLEYVQDWFWYERVGGCGCGSPNAVQNEIRKCLLFAKNTQNDNRWGEYFGIETIYDDPMRMFMLYVLDDKGFIEHGTSINVPWITEFGELYLWVLEQEEEQ